MENTADMNEKALENENKEIARQYKELLRNAYRNLDAEDKKLIRQAFEVAVDAHKDQRRKSGGAYIFHPIAVADIVANRIGLDATSIAAALLHDVVEDTEYTLIDIEQMFGETVARIVNGLTKISSLKQDKDISLQAENFRKMLLTLHDDVRVILIKIADRLHNMQTMDAMRVDKQVKIASETLYIYAPLAHRIGLYTIKTELEDLGLKYTQPDVYRDILDKIKESKEEQDAYIDRFSSPIAKSLKKETIICEIHGRPKSIFSIRRKMIKQNINFDEVYDKFAIRIIYKSNVAEEKFLAWKIYTVVTDFYRPNPIRLRDWISQPKSTGYEALHITVIGPDSKWVEVQIRSERMHEIAEKGYAAHYKYKNNEQKEDQGLDGWLNRLQEALENSSSNAVDFVEEFKLNLYAKEIFVFTPEGDLKSLPKKATALDFGFSVHTEIGLRTRGARVNGKLVPLSQELQNGDQVEIITSSKSKPSASWLDYATTARARSKIKSALRDEKKKMAAEGKLILKRKLKTQKISMTDKVIHELILYFKLKTSLDLFYRIAIGTIDNQKIKEFVATRSNVFVSFIKNRIRKSDPKKEFHKPEITSKYDLLVFGKEEEKLEYKLAQCCNPIPGDEVFGFITVSEGIKVHSQNCPNALQLQSNYAYRIISAKWIDSSQEVFKVIIKLSGIDNIGVVNEVTEVISNQLQLAIYSMSFDTHHGVFEGRITIGIQNKNTLGAVIHSLYKINGIDKVVRE